MKVREEKLRTIIEWSEKNEDVSSSSSDKFTCKSFSTC